MGAREGILEQRLRWARHPRRGSEKGAPRGSETETPPQRLRAGERGQSSCREDGDPQFRVHGVWGGGSSLHTKPFPSPGMSEKPSLSVQPGPSVSWGETVTLQCLSELWGDSFLLSKEGSPAPPQHLRGRDTAAPFRASFTLSPVTSAHGGTYRCYSSNSSSPFLLSHPSDPLELWVSDYTVENLIRMGIAGLILVVLGVLLCQAGHSPKTTQEAARS